MMTSKEVAVTNACEQNVNFTLNIAPPFSLDNSTFFLYPKESKKQKSEVIKINFDPTLKYDRMSGIIKTKMRIDHEDHPHKEFVDIEAEFCFPNLKISEKKLDFGCILNHTSKRKKIQMKNTSVMEIFYEWKFAESEE